jgi:hypothetical protein
MEEGLAEWRKYLPNKREACSKPQYHQKKKKKKEMKCLGKQREKCVNENAWDSFQPPGPGWGLNAA